MLLGPPLQTLQGMSNKGGGLQSATPGQRMAVRKKSSGSVFVTTWDPNNLTNIALSLANLRGDNLETGASRTAKATSARTAGRFYFEINFIGYVFGTMAGLTTSATSTAALLSQTAGVSYRMHTGYQINGASTAMDLGLSTTAPHGFAFNLDAQLAWFINWGAGSPQWNGSPTADPAAGVGGISFAAVAAVGAPLLPAMSVDGDIGQVEAALANFGATAFGGIKPAGFLSWNG